MTSTTAGANPQQTRTRAGWAAIVAGIAGLTAFACLVTYLTSYVDTLIKNNPDTFPTKPQGAK